MKPKPNQKRRAGTSFNSVDTATGYTVRFALGKGGVWWAWSTPPPEGSLAISNGMSLRVARRHAAEAIQLCLEECVENGDSIIPKLEQEG